MAIYKHRRSFGDSDVIPAMRELEVGEIAINMANRSLWTKNDSGEIIRLDRSDSDIEAIIQGVAVSNDDIVGFRQTTGGQIIFIKRDGTDSDSNIRTNVYQVNQVTTLSTDSPMAAASKRYVDSEVANVAAGSFTITKQRIVSDILPDSDFLAATTSPIELEAVRAKLDSDIMSNDSDIFRIERERKESDIRIEGRITKLFSGDNPEFNANIGTADNNNLTTISNRVLTLRTQVRSIELQIESDGGFDTRLETLEGFTGPTNTAIGLVRTTAEAAEATGMALRFALESETEDRLVGDSELGSALESEVEDRLIGDSELRSALESEVDDRVHLESEYDIFIARTDNPHSVTKAQVGLSVVNNTNIVVSSDSVQSTDSDGSGLLRFEKFTAAEARDALDISHIDNNSITYTDTSDNPQTFSIAGKLDTNLANVPTTLTQPQRSAFRAAIGASASASDVAVDLTVIDGSTNAVSGNAVFDELATKQDNPTPGKVFVEVDSDFDAPADGIKYELQGGVDGFSIVVAVETDSDDTVLTPEAVITIIEDDTDLNLSVMATINNVAIADANDISGRVANPAVTSDVDSSLNIRTGAIDAVHIEDSLLATLTTTPAEIITAIEGDIDLVLGAEATTTTHAAADSTRKLATTQYVTTAVTNAVLGDMDVISQLELDSEFRNSTILGTRFDSDVTGTIDGRVKAFARVATTRIVETDIDSDLIARLDSDPAPLTNLEIKTQYEGNLNTNAFTNIEQTKLAATDSDVTGTINTNIKAFARITTTPTLVAENDIDPVLIARLDSDRTDIPIFDFANAVDDTDYVIRNGAWAVESDPVNFVLPTDLISDTDIILNTDSEIVMIMRDGVARSFAESVDASTVQTIRDSETANIRAIRRNRIPELPMDAARDLRYTPGSGFSWEQPFELTVNTVDGHLEESFGINITRGDSDDADMDSDLLISVDTMVIATRDFVTSQGFVTGVADREVTKAKLSATGGNFNQVLALGSSDSDTLIWTDAITARTVAQIFNESDTLLVINESDGELTIDFQTDLKTRVGDLINGQYEGGTFLNRFDVTAPDLVVENSNIPANGYLRAAGDGANKTNIFRNFDSDVIDVVEADDAALDIAGLTIRDKLVVGSTDSAAISFSNGGKLTGDIATTSQLIGTKRFRFTDWVASTTTLPTAVIERIRIVPTGAIDNFPVINIFTNVIVADTANAVSLINALDTIESDNVQFIKIDDNTFDVVVDDVNNILSETNGINIQIIVADDSPSIFQSGQTPGTVTGIDSPFIGSTYNSPTSFIVDRRIILSMDGGVTRDLIRGDSETPFIGNAQTATKLRDAVTISLDVDATGSVIFDGGSDVTLNVDISANTVGSAEINASGAQAGYILALDSDSETIIWQSATTAPVGSVNRTSIQANGDAPGNVLAISSGNTLEWITPRTDSDVRILSRGVVDSEHNFLESDVIHSRIETARTTADATFIQTIPIVGTPTANNTVPVFENTGGTNQIMWRNRDEITIDVVEGHIVDSTEITINRVADDSDSDTDSELQFFIGTFPGTKIDDATVSGVKLINDSVNGSKLATNTVDGSKLATNTVDGLKLTINTVARDRLDGGLEATLVKADAAVTILRDIGNTNQNQLVYAQGGTDVTVDLANLRNTNADAAHIKGITIDSEGDIRPESDQVLVYKGGSINQLRWEDKTDPITIDANTIEELVNDVESEIIVTVENDRLVFTINPDVLSASGVQIADFGTSFDTTGAKIELDNLSLIENDSEIIINSTKQLADIKFRYTSDPGTLEQDYGFDSDAAGDILNVPAPDFTFPTDSETSPGLFLSLADIQLYENTFTAPTIVYKFTDGVEETFTGTFIGNLDASDDFRAFVSIVASRLNISYRSVNDMNDSIFQTEGLYITADNNNIQMGRINETSDRIFEYIRISVASGDGLNNTATLLDYTETNLVGVVASTGTPLYSITGNNEVLDITNNNGVIDITANVFTNFNVNAAPLLNEIVIDRTDVIYADNSLLLIETLGVAVRRVKLNTGVGGNTETADEAQFIQFSDIIEDPDLFTGDKILTVNVFNGRGYTPQLITVVEGDGRFTLTNKIVTALQALTKGDPAGISNDGSNDGDALLRINHNALDLFDNITLDGILLRDFSTNVAISDRVAIQVYSNGAIGVGISDVEFTNHITQILNGLYNFDFDSEQFTESESVITANDSDLTPVGVFIGIGTTRAINTATSIATFNNNNINSLRLNVRESDTISIVANGLIETSIVDGNGIMFQVQPSAVLSVVDNELQDRLNTADFSLNDQGIISLRADLQSQSEVNTLIASAITSESADIRALRGVTIPELSTTPVGNSVLKYNSTANSFDWDAETVVSVNVIDGHLAAGDGIVLTLADSGDVESDSEVVISVSADVVQDTIVDVDFGEVTGSTEKFTVFAMSAGDIDLGGIRSPRSGYDFGTI